MTRLMVIDDDHAIRHWLAAVLRNAGYTVRSFGSAEDALPAIREEAPDLILADIRLPGASGLDLLGLLRADPGTAALPVVLITSVGHRHIFRQGMELGADDFITKPLSVDDVTRAVAARLERARVNGMERGAAGAGAPPDLMPVRIGRFHVESRLARGTNAEVFLARDAAGKPAAIKLLPNRGTLESEQVLKRFLHEMDVATAFRHPNLAVVLDRGVTDAGPYVAFEYFPMGDLARLVSHGVSPNIACRVVAQVAAGLAVLHAAGIIHRDIKPGNIMVRSANSFVVTDFGTAKITGADSGVTSTGQILGTPSYISPEQILRQPIGPQSDIYSLGVVFYELLTGLKPFAGGDYHAILYDHVSTPSPALPARLQKFQPMMNRMLAKDPALRFQRADELIDAVSALAY